ncbi:MAG: glycerophosphodiester phosphodiesterase [Clostridia bacterium]|nr:glycerophosphodiester phosphodiesterase [Clostridia bacterium]
MKNSIYNTLVYAHRGASGYRPENTMASFELAAEMGADGIELDIQLSKDGKIVVCHDYKIDRTSNGNGYVKDMTYEELRRFNYANGKEGTYEIPLLEEVLELIKKKDMILNIEIKNDAYIPYEGIEEKTVKLVRDMGVGENIIYSSFYHQSLRRLKFTDPSARIAILYEAGLYEPWNYGKQLGVCALHPHKSSVYEPFMLDYSHREKLLVNTWTVNDEKEMRALTRRGVDGLITNYPDVALKVVKEENILKIED